MLKTTFAIALFTFAGASFAAGDQAKIGKLLAAANAANGEKLFAASQCLSCHGTEMFSAPNRKVQDLYALNAQVRLCDSNLNTNWFDLEVYDVVVYLNQQYYKFPIPQE